MKCSYCKHDMHEDRIRCKNCGAIQYEVNKEGYEWGNEKIYFENAFIRITNKIFMSGNQIFAIDSISSIRVDNKEKGISNLGWGVTILAIILIITFPGWWKLLGVILMYVGLKTPKIYHSLKLKTSNGEQEALVINDSELIQKIVESLKEASHHKEELKPQA